MTGMAVHLAVRGRIACGSTERRLTFNPVEVTCQACKDSTDYSLAGKHRVTVIPDGAYL